MLTQPVAIVHEVARRERVFGLEVDMAPVAVSNVPLVLMFVAAETGRHFGAKLRRLRLGHPHVASHAVPLHIRHVALVLETQMLAGKLGPLAHEGLAMARAARVLVVRLGVTAAANGVAGEMEGARIAGERNPRVALHAVDPLDDVRTMFEGMGWRRLFEPEYPRACSERERDDQKKSSREQRAPAHRISRVRDRRRRALVS